jgi:hypothetical protein
MTTDYFRFAVLIRRHQKQAVDTIGYSRQSFNLCPEPLMGAVYSFGVVGEEA